MNDQYWPYMDKGDNAQAFKYLNLAIKKLESLRKEHDKDNYDRMLSGIQRSLKEIEKREE